MRRVFRAIILFSAALCAVPALAQISGQRGGGASDGGAAAARVDRLEQQLNDLQGVVAAVETLAKSNSGGGSGYAASAGGGASSEQIRQLSEQLADLTQRIERLEARLGGGGGGAAPQPRPQSGYGAAPADGFEDKEQLPPLQGQQTPDRYGAQSPRQPAPQYGSAGDSRTSGRAYSGDQAAGTPAPRGYQSQAGGAGSGQALFDQAMSAYNRREYAAAQTYFNEFLQNYPNDPAAGKAQYWAGEAAMVSGDFDNAAKSFLKVYTQFPRSEKVPEALLNLAISLRRLNKAGEACGPLQELQKRYPQAAQTLLQRAETERRRANCS